MSYRKAWEAGYVRDRARGRRRYVPAGETRTRLRDLTQAGVPPAAVAAATGLSDTAVGHILDGRHRQVQHGTAERVAAVTLTQVYDRAAGHVPNVGAVRRVEALMALGWRKSDLLAEGVPPAQLVTRPRDRISASAWRRVRAVYDRLSMTPGPSPTARARASARGYAPPLAWDDDTIDDPRARPDLGDHTTHPCDPVDVDLVAVDRVVTAGASAGTDGGCDTRIRLTPDEVLAVTWTLTGRGASDREVATALGVSTRSVLRMRQQHGIPTAHPAGVRRSDPHDLIRESASLEATVSRIAPGGDAGGVGTNPRGSDRLHRSMRLTRAAVALDARATAAPGRVR